MKVGWQFEGTCSLPEHHDAEAGKRAGLARKACYSCPVASDCLEYALANDVYGIWANTNRQQRKALA
jgi:WhiB family redox-sensing transcriptional regulator